jgi:hypothetical protein
MISERMELAKPATNKYQKNAYSFLFHWDFLHTTIINSYKLT